MTDGQRGLGGDQLQQLFCFWQKFFSAYHMIHKSILMCCFRIDHIPCHQQLHCPALTNQLYQPLRAAITGDQSKVHFRLAKPGLLTGNSEMTGHGQFTSASQRKTIHRCYHRLAAVFKLKKYILPFFGKRSSFRNR